jgi:hypothetical protein
MSLTLIVTLIVAVVVVVVWVLGRFIDGTTE